MSTTVNYKGNTITTVNNQTKVLSTGGTWLEGDITLVDVTSGGAIPEYGTKTITENGTYAAEDDNLDGYSEVTVNVSGGGSSTNNDVNFYDYDGTLLHSYSASDAAALTAMPSNPSHSGLTAQGWNYTLSEMKAEVTAKGSCDIGQMYVTDDDKTRLYCHFETGRLHPYLGLCPNGTVTVDWGDGSATETMTGTSLNSVITIDHEYAAEGDYIITLAMENGTFAFYGTSNTSYVLRKDATTTANIHRVYTSAIRKIELGSAARIGNYGFNYCYNLKTITMHDAVTIGDYAFNNCYSLTNIEMPSSVTSIGSSAFYGCYSLTGIEIPSGVTIIGASAFNNCYSLISIEIPSSVTIIGASAFNNCYSLISIEIPSSVTSISTSAFNNCYSLTNIEIPSSVTSISTSAFSNCHCLTNIEMPSSVTSIGSNAFYGCYSLTGIEIPSGVTSIGNSAFYGCYSLTGIEIPSGVTIIGYSAFSGCYSLTSIDFPSSYTGTALNQEVRNCYSLATLTIPATITSIAANTFAGCYGMAEYHFRPTTPPTLASTNAFTNIQSDCIIYVPQGCLEAYQTATNWSTYAGYMREEANA